MQIYKRNNPGNIRPSTAYKWQGQTGTSNNFVIFDSTASGIRAIVKDLNTKAKRGLNTIDSIIKVYAPKSENNTENYIQYVATKTGIGRYTKLAPEKYIDVIAAMLQMESGQPTQDSTRQLVKQYVSQFFGQASEEIKANFLPVIAVLLGAYLLVTR